MKRYQAIRAYGCFVSIGHWLHDEDHVSVQYIIDQKLCRWTELYPSTCHFRMRARRAESYSGPDQAL